MKVICAPDSFKGSLTAVEAAEAMARGVRRALPDAEVDLCPVSDGGEGFHDVIHLNCPWNVPVLGHVVGPLGRKVRSTWSQNEYPDRPHVSIIEMAKASGLLLVPEGERNPLKTTSYGTGELLQDAITTEAPQIMIGLGGSATNDGGCGMAQALGVKFYDANGWPIEKPITGGMLETIRRIDVSGIDRRLHAISVIAASDVDNPLTGPNGASYVYSPQKGADPKQVEQLDRGLRHLAALFREQLDADVEDRPGAGAAGGMGAGLMVFCNAVFRSGLEVVLELAEYDRRVRGCDLCLTGEGQLDGQSLSGKAVLGVAKAAAKHSVPTVALVGKLGPGHEQAVAAGLKDALEIAPDVLVEESMSRAAELLEDATARAMSLYG